LFRIGLIVFACYVSSPTRVILLLGQPEIILCRANNGRDLRDTLVVRWYMKATLSQTDLII